MHGSAKVLAACILFVATLVPPDGLENLLLVIKVVDPLFSVLPQDGWDLASECGGKNHRPAQLVALPIT